VKGALIGHYSPALLLIGPQGLHLKSNRKSVGAAETPLPGHSVGPEGLWVQVSHLSHPPPAEGTHSEAYIIIIIIIIIVIIVRLCPGVPPAALDARLAGRVTSCRRLSAGRPEPAADPPD